MMMSQTDYGSISPLIARDNARHACAVLLRGSPKVVVLDIWRTEYHPPERSDRNRRSGFA